ncbi:hypothetical protein MPER_16301, partial [Moniliophthora perniciosa FA553]
MTVVTAIYMFINIGYFAVVSKADILNSKRIVAALFFRNLFALTGAGVERFYRTFDPGELTSRSIPDGK